MAKCTRCGKHGLFLKLDKGSGFCANCTAEIKLKRVSQEVEEKQIELARLDSRIESAQKMCGTFESLEILNREIGNKNAELGELTRKIEASEGAVATASRRVEKLKPIAKSITEAFNVWVAGGTIPANRAIESLELESLLPSPELNCLSMKQLNSRYKALRKQILDVCAAYESRYTTKANAAIYKLMVLAMEAELETVLYKLQFGKLEVGNDAVRKLTAKYYSVATEGNQSIAPTLRQFIGQIESLYLDVVATEYEYYVQRERAKEEQRAIKEQMKQEAEERKQLEQERKRVEAEEKKYSQEMERIRTQMQESNDGEVEKLRARLAELESLVNKVEEKKAEIINLQNGKAGTIYIISNIGSFGENVFKVGMTRRLEPQDRINELGNASVPFPFDVHSFIFSQDAPALETALHKELNDRRVNKVNLRKEFFSISVEELQQMVERIDPTAPFKTTALAEQYRQSLEITVVPDADHIVSDDDDEEEAV